MEDAFKVGYSEKSRTDVLFVKGGGGRGGCFLPFLYMVWKVFVAGSGGVCEVVLVSPFWFFQVVDQTGW